MDDEMEIAEQDVITQARDMYIHKDIYFPESCGVAEVGEDFCVEAYVRVPKSMVPPPHECKTKD